MQSTNFRRPFLTVPSVRNLWRIKVVVCLGARRAAFVAKTFFVGFVNGPKFWFRSGFWRRRPAVVVGRCVFSKMVNATAHSNDFLSRYWACSPSSCRSLFDQNEKHAKPRIYRARSQVVKLRYRVFRKLSTAVFEVMLMAMLPAMPISVRQAAWWYLKLEMWSPF